MDITTHNKPIFRKLIALLIIFVLLINNSKAQNLLVNGDFESGISGTGFQTQSPYNYLSSLSGNSNPGDYAIITDPNAMNTTWFLHCKDHTNGTGKMMVIDGITTGGQQRLWKAGNSGGGVGPLTVGTTYTFSYWVRSVSKSVTDINTTANIGIQFNNASSVTLTAGSTLLPFDTATGWVQVKYTFVPTNAYVNIEMYNNNTSAVGNDFALDDIAVLAPPLPLAISYSLNNPTCYNNTDGYIIAYGIGGTAPYTYSFDGGTFSAINTLTGLATSSHTVTVKDALLNTVTSSTINTTAPLNPLTATASVNPICAGNNTTLTAANGGASYNWTANPVDASLTTPGVYNPVVSPANTTTYTVTSSTTLNVNLIYNGNFSLGNTGFTTDYTYKTVNTGGAQRSYGVMPNAQVFFNTFSTCGDHTTGTQNMYVVDGSLNSADKVWCQTVVVKPSTTYTFSYWIQTLTINNPAQIETKINGVTVPASTSANPVTAPATVVCGNWQQVSYTWTSGVGVTTAEICLYDKNVNANGNDFALDDISFTGSYGCNLSKTVTIAVNPLATTNNINLFDCNNVTYHGNTYTNNTIVRDTLKAVQGCDSVYNVVNITVNSTIATNKTNNLASCKSIIYKGNTYTSSTILKDTLKSVKGCDSVYNTVNITINPLIPTTNTQTLLSCKAIVYNGNSYNTSIVLKDTIKSLQGCDSIYNIVNINISPITTTTNNATASGCGSVVYKSITYTASTVLKDTIRTLQGCDSIYNIATITVYPAIAAPTASVTQQPNCASPTGTIVITAPTGVNLLYSIDGVNYQSSANFVGLAPATYSVTVKDSNTNCISPLLNLVVDTVQNIPTPTGYVSVQPTCSNAFGTFIISSPHGSNYAYYINGSILAFVDTIYPGSSSGTYSIVAFDVNTGCISDTLNLILNPYIPITPTNNIINLVGCNSVIFKGITYTTNALLKDTVKSYQGCDSVYNNVNITITPLATITNTQTISSCKSIVYNSNTYSASTVLRDTVKSTNGCDSVYNIVNININPITATANNQTISSCKSVVYNTITYSSSIVLKDTIKSFQGCDSIYNTVNININPITTSTNAQTLSSCKSVVYNGNTYSSSTVLKDTMKSLQGCDSIYNTVNININPIATSTNTQTLSSCKSVVYNGNTYSISTILKDTMKSLQGCDSIYNIVSININPIITKTNNQTISSCKTIVYNGNTYLVSTVLRDTVKSTKGCDSVYNIVSISINPITAIIKTTNYTGCGSVNYKNVLYTTSISYFDTIKNLQGCDSIYNINNIVVYPLPKIIVGGNLLVMPNSSVVLNPSISNAISVSFTPSKYLDDSTSSNPICTPLSDQTYLIKATSIDGCTDTSSFKIFTVKPISVPNVFSPNGDGINDTWDIAHITDYPFATISIFNRQGQLLKSSKTTSIRVWDGTYNGQPVPVAVYYWIIKLTPNSEPMSGIVTVLR